MTRLLFVWFERSLYWRVCWKLVIDFFFAYFLESSRRQIGIAFALLLFLDQTVSFSWKFDFVGFVYERTFSRCSCEWSYYPDGARKRLLAHPRFVFGRSRKASFVRFCDAPIIEPSFFWYESLHWEYSFPGSGSPPSPFSPPVKWWFLSFWNRMNPIVDGVKLDETLVLSCRVVRSRVVEGITDTGWSAASFVPSLLWF